MKTRSAAFLALTVVLAMAWSVPVPATAKKPFLVGVDLGLSGFLGQPNALVKMGMVLATEEINQKGGINGRPLKLDFRDNGSSIAKSIGIVLKFAREKRILAIIGPLWNVMEPGMLSAAEREKIARVSVGPAAPLARKKRYKWSFHVAQSDIIVAKQVVRILRAKGYKRVLAFYDEQPLWISVAKLVKTYGAKHGIRVIISGEQLKARTVDFSPVITKSRPIIDKHKIQVIFLSCQPQIGTVFLKGMRTQGLKLAVVGNHAFGAFFVPKMGGQAVNGILFPTGKIVVPGAISAGDPQKKVVMHFDRAFRKRFKMPAGQLAGNGYDAVMIVARALARCGQKVTRAALRKAIENIKGYVGVTGVFNYSPSDHEGLRTDSLIFATIKNGAFVRFRLK